MSYEYIYNNFWETNIWTGAVLDEWVLVEPKVKLIQEITNKQYTMHLPDPTYTGVSKEKDGIFFYNNNVMVDTFLWNKDSRTYIKLLNGDIDQLADIPDEIRVKRIPLFNTGLEINAGNYKVFPTKCKTVTKIFNNYSNDALITKTSNEFVLPGNVPKETIYSLKLERSDSTMDPYLIDFPAINGTELKPMMKPEDQYYKIILELIDSATNKAIDKIEVKFRCKTTSNINISPESATLYADATIKFNVTAPIQEVNWSIQEGLEGGTITADGTYKAPPNNNPYYSGDSKYHIIAQSRVNSTIKKVIEVTIVRPQLEENIKTSEYDSAASGYFNVMYSAIKLRNISTGAKDLMYYHGPYKKYYDNYIKLNTEGFYEKGKKTNVWTYYDSTGNKTETRTYSNDMLNGLKTKYWSSGKKQEETNYTNDVPEGLYTYYNNNASNSIFEQGNYAIYQDSNGRYHYKVGIWKTYYNEVYTTMCIYITERLYINGYETGTEKSYLPNGDIISEIEYLNGKKNGIAKSYTNKKIQLENNYKNDLLDGLSKRYDNPGSGVVLEEGNYIQGKREGIWISRDMYGKDTEYNEYKNGVWINVTFPK